MKLHRIMLSYELSKEVMTDEAKESQASLDEEQAQVDAQLEEKA